MTAPVEETDIPPAPPPEQRDWYPGMASQLAAQSAQQVGKIFEAAVPTVLESMTPSMKTLMVAAVVSALLRFRSRARALAAARVQLLAIQRTGRPIAIRVPAAPPGERERLQAAVETLLTRAVEAAPPRTAPEPDRSPHEPTQGDSEREQIAQRARERRAGRAAREAERRESRKQRRADLRAERAEERRIDKQFADEARRDAALARREQQRESALERDTERRLNEQEARSAGRRDQRAKERERRAQQRARLERLASAESLQAGRDAVLESAELQNEQLGSLDDFGAPEIMEGWIRQLNGESCERCETWADGKVRPLGHRFKWHVSCDCTARLVWTKELDDGGLDFTELDEPIAAKRDKFSGVR